MNIFPERPEYLPTWVNAKRFSLLWQQTDNGLFVDNWSGEPKKNWFKYDVNNNCIGFKTADVSFDQRKVEFVNGRHRTRWQLQQNNEVVPIGLTEDGFRKAKELDLSPERIKVNM